MKIVYVVPHPVKGAVGHRVLGVARALLANQRVDEVVVIGPSHETGDYGQSGLNFAVAEALPAGKRSPVSKLRRRLRLGRDTVAALAATTPAPDLVVIYGGGALYMRRIQHWARSRGVAVAADMVEWYDSSHLPMGRLGPYALDNWLMMTRVAPRCDGIIAISTFLARHFSEMGNDTVVVVPPVVDTQELADQHLSAVRPDRVELIYCGDPGKKDRLDLVLRSVIEIDSHGTRLRLTVAGPTSGQIAAIAGVEDLPPVINAVGPLTRAQCLELVRVAHWMPLIRDDQRFAHAGFPTKVAEAMCVGTPIISNFTSDISKVLDDEVTGISVEEANLSSTKGAILRALNLGPDKYHSISRAAFRRAHDFFDYRQYLEPLDGWLDRVMGRVR